MRVLWFIFLSVTLASCGGSGGSKSSSLNPVQPEQSKPQVPEPTTVTVTPTDIRQIDLLDVAVDVPLEIVGNKMIFKRQASDSAQGQHLTCDLSITPNEVYEFNLTGATLSLSLPSGKIISLNRVSGDEGSIIGSWFSSDVDNGTSYKRRFTFVSETRLVTRKHCEG